MENGNPQATPVATPPTAPEPIVAELQAKVAELEKQSEGRLRDLQSERAKVQELKAKVNSAPAPSAETPKDVTQDELGKVLKPYIDPVLQRVKSAEAFVANTYRDKALEFLASKTGKTKEAVVNDTDLDSKLTSIVRRYGFQGNVYDVTQRAYEVMELENLREKEVERRRVAEANGNNSLPTGTRHPEPIGNKEFSETEFNSMPMHQYEKLANEGSFVMDETTHKITYTPNPK